MLDKNSMKVLSFLAKHPGQYFTEYQLNQNHLNVNYPIMESLSEQKCVVRTELEEPYFSEWDSPTYEYQIAPRGKALLEERKRSFWVEFRAWITLLIAIAAFVQSFFF